MGTREVSQQNQRPALDLRRRGHRQCWKRSEDAQRRGHVRWVSKYELVFPGGKVECHTRRAPEMAEQEKGGGLLNRTACGGQRAGEA